MTIQNFYPVFENGQVLTSASLNDIIDYLEPQDRLTRSRLIGIGIVCGFEMDFGAGTLTLGKGVAVTSEGFLIAENEVALNRFRPYTVPQPDTATATDEEKAEARYPFLFDGATQRQAFELLPTSFVPAPGEAAPGNITAAFLADKTVMLFLERSRASLKNCDVNDCSDKGSEMSVTSRRLVVSRATADKILEQEKAIAGRPVDRANHPRLTLAPSAMEKLNPSGSGALSYPALTARQVALASTQIATLVDAGKAAYAAYQPVLEPLWPATLFPQGPLPPHHTLPLFGTWAAMPALAQYLYGAAADLTLALNEFTAAAALYDAECAPDERRFPRHVLVGDPAAMRRASNAAPTKASELPGWDPAKLAAGAGPQDPPAPRRHHFVPSPLHGTGREAELQALFHRFVLIAQSFDPRKLIGAPLRITPSRDGTAPLGDRAIPAWLGFAPGGDLFNNWSWPRSAAQLRSTISAYALTPDDLTRHPLLMRRDGDDFLRIEGVVGLPLGTAIGEIVAQKRALGLSFGVESVWLGSDGDSDAVSREAAAAVMRRVLMCQMRELDVMFLTLMAGLFAFMVWIVRTLGTVDATKATRKPTAPAPAGGATLTLDTRRLALTSGVRLMPITLDTAAEKELNRVSDATLERLRRTATVEGTLVRDIAVADATAEVPKTAVAEIFNRARDKAAGGELIDRVKIAVKEADPAADADAAYPAVALMARAEEMIAASSAGSVAEFDQPRFTTAIRGLADAYSAYADVAETDATKAGAETAAANAAIVENRGVMAAAAAQLSGASITAELEKMLLRLFEKQTLSEYARQHPGLEHKGGVPLGGTLVLLYLHREALNQALSLAFKAAAPAYSGIFRKLTGQAPSAPDENAAMAAFKTASVPRSDDALEQFVVVGDLCLPTLCCDAECAEGEVFDRIKGGKPVPADNRRIAPVPPAPTPVEPAPPPAPSPTPPTARTGTLTGTAVLLRGTAETEVAGVVLSVTSADGTTKNTDLPADGSFQLTLAAGKYRLTAAIRGRASPAVDVTVRAGATTTAKLLIPA